MEFVEGVEMGVGAYFDGDKFLTPACLDWEHKRFFPGRSRRTHRRDGHGGDLRPHPEASSSARSAAWRSCCASNGYCGYVNLNTIVNEHGIWPLEFTCRFGYPGFAILDAVAGDAVGRALFMAMIDKIPIEL